MLQGSIDLIQLLITEPINPLFLSFFNAFEIFPFLNKGRL
jgi:hypothetical protein